MGAISAFSAATTAAAGDPENKELYKEAKAKLKELKDAYEAIGKKDYALAFGYEGDSKETDVEAAKLEFQERISLMEEPFDDIAGPEDEEEDKTELTDEQKGKIADMEKDIAKTEELLSQAQNPEDGSEPDAGKITGLQDTLKKKEDKLYVFLCKKLHKKIITHCIYNGYKWL